MTAVTLSLQEDYWENFQLQKEDVEFLYNYLLELEMPETSRGLVAALVSERIRREKQAIEQRRTSGGDVYAPKGEYRVEQRLVFPAFNWRRGKVTTVRPGQNPNLGNFHVIQVEFESGEIREFASGLESHKLNDPPKIARIDSSLEEQAVIDGYADLLIERLEEDLGTNPDFVRIAGNWFPRTLLIDVNVGHLNLAEAVLEVGGGGPLSTPAIINQIELSSDVNPRLLEFSLNLALQEDGRFDEVGPSGDVLWFLRRLEPAQVLDPPVFLHYMPVDYDRSALTDPMLALERELDDELSPLSSKHQQPDKVQLRLIFPHWRSGTMPLSARLRHLFPTAYEAPRIRFTFVDGDTSETFPAWVVREKRYVFGLKEWYEARGLIPGSIVTVMRSKKPGEVIVKTDSRRASREWIRTVLVGSDGGIVFAMLKQIIEAPYDDRMGIAIPDVDALDQAWERSKRQQPPFEQVVVNAVRELSKLSPQGHVHASELYAAINITRRCPPGPLLATLASRPWFTHVGDLHYRSSNPE